MDVRDIKFGKIDTFFGSLLTCLVAAFIIIATAGVFYYNPGRADHRRVGRPDGRADARGHARPPLGRVGQAAVRHRPVRRRPAGGVVHLAFHQLGRGRGVRLGPFAEQERPRGALVLRRLPADAPVGGRGVAGGQHRACRTRSRIFVQVVAVTLLPAALVFLILLLNDKPLMGEYVNTRWQNFVNWAIVVFVIVDFHGLRSLRFCSRVVSR